MVVDSSSTTAQTISTSDSPYTSAPGWFNLASNPTDGGADSIHRLHLTESFQTFVCAAVKGSGGASDGEPIQDEYTELARRKMAMEWLRNLWLRSELRPWSECGRQHVWR